MGVWTLLIITVVGTCFGGLLASLLFPSFQAFIKRTWRRIKGRPHFSKKELEGIYLQTLVEPLLRINAIPHFPDALKSESIKDILVKLGEDAKKVKSREYEAIRNKVIEFSKNAEKLDANTNPLDALKMLGRETSINLAEEIRQIADDIGERRRKKK